MRPSRQRPRVALLIDTLSSYPRRLLEGVVGYVKEHEPWSFYHVMPGRDFAPMTLLEGWTGDGIIARIDKPEVAKAVMQAGVPAVDVSGTRHVSSLPWVEPDDHAIASLAAEHLLQRGFKNYGYCGTEYFEWSRMRGARFSELVRREGYRCDLFMPPSKSELRNQVIAIAEWLKKLRKPVGIFACNDIRGGHVLDACQHAGLRVPDDVAVLGVDNDELFCELASPTLSSVVPDTYRTGYEAAAWLDRLMGGERIPALELRVQPLGVRQRQSTDVLAADDPLVARAVQFIRDHACEAISVEDVLRAVPLSRRVLEARFQKLLRHSPHAAIIRTRLDRVKQFLTETDLPLDQIAERTGFEHPEYLSVLFKRELGVTPGEHRAKHQRLNFGP